MKKIVLFFILFHQFSYSQYGKVLYSVKVSTDITNIPEDKQEFISKMIDYANNQTFELNFNKDITHFKFIEKLNYSEDYNKQFELIVQAGMTSHSNIYFNHTNKIEIHVDENGNNIKYDYESHDWEITNEKKIIGDYFCYKAINTKELINNRTGKKITKETIAWFAPSLPFKFGPKNYFGLPGLILELNVNKTTFYATKIELFEKEMNINFPIEKIISKEDYEKKLKEQMGM